ncbi:MAG TPA: outer membrane lipoprotein-sorting protein [Desulfonatronum sp.]|nr:outer membrane lipoprotein-sorting protein [Desulfonatronum sp.]
MHRLTCSCIALFFLLFAFSTARAMDKEELLRTIDRNLAPETHEQYRKMINIEPDGSQREFVLYTVKKGADKVASLFLSPASEQGRSTLRLGENMWLYIPNVGRPIRITSLQSVTGGVFNNADIMRLDFHVEYDVQFMEDRGEVFFLDLKAKNKTVAYDRLEMTVDKANLVPIEVKCLTAADMLIKTLYFKQITDFGNNIVRPAVIETDSPLHQGYRSVMIFSQVKPRDLPDEVFTQNYMPRLEGLLR